MGGWVDGEGALVGGGWKEGRREGRKEGSSGPSGPPEREAEEVYMVRSAAPFQEAFSAPWGGRGCRGPITKTTRHRGSQSSADHGLHIRLTLELILDLVCTS